MALYLKIENPGICPPDCITMMGVSMADTSSDRHVIGQFGSGSGHAIAVLLRHGIPHCIYSSTTKMEFLSREQEINDGLSTKIVNRVCARFSGQKSGLQELGFTLEYGRLEWKEPAMALREFICNAIDRCIREFGHWKNVVIEVVDEKQMRAKRDYTRVYVELQPEILDFYNNLHRWFLHFKEPLLIEQAVLSKNDRGLKGSQAAVVYRRGVRVRALESQPDSLFDYNINDLQIDEARKADEHGIRYQCASTLSMASEAQLLELLSHPLDKPCLEATLDGYSLRPSGDKSMASWRAAANRAYGDDTVACEAQYVDAIRRRGKKPVVVRDNVLTCLRRIGFPTDQSLLSIDNLLGREVFDAPLSLRTAVSAIWAKLSEVSMTNDKPYPQVKTFDTMTEGEAVTLGYYRDGAIHIAKSLLSDEPSEMLQQTILEELAHYITQSSDCSRDFQNFLIQFAIRVAFRGAVLCEDNAT